MSCYVSFLLSLRGLVPNVSDKEKRKRVVQRLQWLFTVAILAEVPIGSIGLSTVQRGALDRAASGQERACHGVSTLDGHDSA